MNKGCDTEPTILSPFPTRLESLTICGCLAKAAVSPQLFTCEDPEYEFWLGRS